MADGPKIGLLAKEEPPAFHRRSQVFTVLLDLVPQLRAVRGEWHRIAEFPGATSAHGYAKKLRERYPEQIETRATRDDGRGGGSVLYARWVGNRVNGDRP